MIFSFILNFDISCLGTVNMYKLNMGFTTQIYRDLFYFMYLPPLSHSWLLGAFSGLISNIMLVLIWGNLYVA